MLFFLVCLLMMGGYGDGVGAGVGVGVDVSATIVSGDCARRTLSGEESRAQ